jgi:hypothetical protein
MKYLCLAYRDERGADYDGGEPGDALSGGAPEGAAGPWERYGEMLRRSGRLVVRMAPRVRRSSVLVRPGRGRPEVLDGASMPARPPVGEVFVIEARDLNEAIRLVSEHPAARSACGGRGVEVLAVDRIDLSPGREARGPGRDRDER